MGTFEEIVCRHIGDRAEHVLHASRNDRSERIEVSSNLHAGKRIRSHSFQNPNFSGENSSVRTEGNVESTRTRTHVFRRGKELQPQISTETNQTKENVSFGEINRR